MNRRCGLLLLAVVTLLPILPGRLAADDRGAAELLPSSTLIYAELPDPARLLDLILEHPLRAQLTSLRDVQKALEGKPYLEFKAAVAVIEARLGQTWPKLLASAAGGGLAVGFDAESDGAVLLVKARDEAALKNLVDTLVQLARQDAQDKDRPDPIKTADYRGVPAYGIDKVKLAVAGSWLVLTNKPETGQRVLDNLLDGSDAPLAADGQFQTARRSAPREATAWAYVNIAALRDAGAAKQLFQGRADNPLGELLVGGLLSNLQKSPFVTATLSAAQQHLRLDLASPHEHAWVFQPRHYFFGPDGNGQAPPLLAAANVVFSLSAYRDISQMWLQAGDLFDERVNDQLATAESNLSTLFSGKDFGEEILGAVHPEVQLVVARQDYQDGPQPAIKLPAFGLAFQLKDAATMQPELRRTFQSLIGFLNVVGSMQGQPQLDLDMQREGDLQVVSATYLPEQDADLRKLKINYNFSPAVAFVKDRFIVASTRQLARELARSEADGGQPPAPANTAAAANFQVLRDILDDNRGQLIAQNMLQEGNTKQEAEREINTLLDLLGLLRDASLRLATADNMLRLTLTVNLNPAP